jgi:hypothetical protein
MPRLVKRSEASVRESEQDIDNSRSHNLRSYYSQRNFHLFKFSLKKTFWYKFITANKSYICCKSNVAHVRSIQSIVLLFQLFIIFFIELEAARSSTNKIKRVLAVHLLQCTHLRVDDLIEQLLCLI